MNRVARCLRALGWKQYQVGSGAERGKRTYRKAKDAEVDSRRAKDTAGAGAEQG